MTNKRTSEQHPSYGYIRLSRVCGGTGRLFMSPLRHDHRISIVIGEASLERHLNTDQHYTGKQIAEVEMSEEQFARFVCSAGQGSGVPCTLRHVGGKTIPQPDVQLKSERYNAEAKEKVAEAVSVLDKLAKDLDVLTAKLPKKTQEELRGRVGEARRLLDDHLPWIVQMMHEHMDKIVNSAKLEVEAYINRAVADRELSIAAAPAIEVRGELASDSEIE